MANILILVRDDNLRTQFTDALTTAGYTVYQTTSAAGALSMLTQRQYDVIVTSYYRKVIEDNVLIQELDRFVEEDVPAVVVIVENGPMPLVTVKESTRIFERTVRAPIEDASFVQFINDAIAAGKAK